MKIYSTNPYYDDYDETKKFYRILFRPGRAVQARELTQLQTLLQGQIERFGKNIFKEGSIVIPGEQVYDTNYKFVKLATSYNSVDADDVIADLLDDTLIGQTTGVRARVVNFTVGTSTEPPTVFVKYVSSGTNGSTTAFSASEILINSDSSISVQAASTSATGSGAAYSIGDGVMFVKGSFVYVEEQTKIISKYSIPANIIVGFDITESVVTSDDDESLLDPSIGTFNYFAPGADRYKIDLTLNTRSFTPVEADDPNFVEIARIEDSEIIKQIKAPSYNILADTLARRTYDESGDYTVRPYRLQLKEHLRTSNANSAATAVNGLYTAANGGNADLFVGVVTAGKAYVKGYEIDSIRTKYVNSEKARDYVSVTNSTIATTFGNYVFVTNLNSIPDLTTLATLDLYNQFNITPATPNGTKIGTARVRSIEFSSGTVGSATSIYKIFLFNVNMDTGYSFSRDVKQLYSDNASIEDFTADIYPTVTVQTGTVTSNSLSNTVVGAGTLFNTDIKVNDYIEINSQKLRVLSIASNFSANVTPRPSANLVGVTYSLDTATINDPTFNSYIFPLPYSVIKSVDNAGTATTYNTRRVYSRTLSSGNVSITSGTDEVFAGYSTDNYHLVIASGGSAGTWVDLTSKVTRSGSPTGKTVTISLSGLYTNEDVVIVTTLQKSSSAADKKVKTLVSGATLDYTTEAAATAAFISLGKADIYQVSSVSMSSNAFGTAYTTTNAVDITDRYTIDNGQRTTFYDVGSIVLKPGAAKPAGPIRITYDYFTHGAGDYFSVESYNDIDYKDIPTYTAGGITYTLADSLDFRSRINDAGTGFSSTGASVTEFLDFTNDVITDYEYYLPRIDKMVLDRGGRVRTVKGISSLNPVEPLTPDDSMTLYILKQTAYVKDIAKDIQITPVDNKRFTMRDIGRIENRVKNLEYYTSLSLAEKDTQVFQIKDALGFDRFKNGFVVDSFKGHGIGDVYNTDYSTAIDFSKNEARPLCETRFVKVREVGTAGRSANNYVLSGDIITLAYTEEAFISNTKSSKTVNLNPFNVVLFNGKITLDPPSDIWFNDTKLPDVYRNSDGNYDSVVADARAKGTYGTIWGNWRDVQYGNNGNELVQQRTGIDYNVVETIDTSTNNDVVINRSIIPKMRDAIIKFTAEGMKPNTVLYAYFNNTSVSPYTKPLNKSGNVYSALNDIYPTGTPITTDATGNASGIFVYTAATLDFNTGTYTFRLSDSDSNSTTDVETFAEALFTSSGEIRNVANEIVSTRNARLDSKEVTDTQTVFVGDNSTPDSGNDDDPPEIATPPFQATGYISQIYRWSFGRDGEEGGVNHWANRFDQYGLTRGSWSTIATAAEVSAENIGADGGITSMDGNNKPIIPASINSAAQIIYTATREIVTSGYNNGEGNNPNGLLGTHLRAGATVEDAITATTIQLVTAVANHDIGLARNATWDVDALRSIGDRT